MLGTILYNIFYITCDVVLLFIYLNNITEFFSTQAQLIKL